MNSFNRSMNSPMNLPTWRHLACLVAALAIVACGGGKPLPNDDDDHDHGEVLAPAGLTYGVNPAAYVVGVAVENEPSLDVGTPPLTYTIAPALPGGLELNAAHGTISGTPAAPSPPAVYVVQAENSAGSTTVNLTLSVTDGVVAPTNLNYSFADAAYVVDEPIPLNTPSVSGTEPYTFAATPALPTGLTINTSTGVFSGTPTVVSGRTEFTITATNAAGSTQAAVFIAVTSELQPPTLIGYGQANPIYLLNIAITPNTPSLGGGPTAGFSVEPALPAGLALHGSTGVIFGTASQLLEPAAPFTITASNDAGSASFVLNIAIEEPVPPEFAIDAGPHVYGTPGTAIAAIEPTDVQNVASFSVAPALPDELLLNSSTGVISGIPRAAAAMAATTYTLTAHSPEGLTVSHDVSIALYDIDSLDAAEVHDVDIEGFEYVPSTLSVAVGHAVRWINQDEAPHTATSTSNPSAWSNSPTLAQGGEFTLIFNQAASYPYVCNFHPGMTASVTAE